MGDRIAVLLNEANIALTPLVGKVGIAKIQTANRIAISKNYPWLDDGLIDTTLSEPEKLRTPLNAQESAIAQAAGEALLLNFYFILTELVGAPLVDIFLKPAWNKTTSAEPRN